jgi:urease accessory protein
MEIITEILGNVYQSHDWRKKLQQVDVYYACLDQWTAQKSRFLVVTDDGTEFPVALRRHSPINDGDILYYAPHENRAVVVKLSLCEVMVIDLSALLPQSPVTMLRTAIEVGHALGNQHWPAVVKGTRVFVPLAVDKQVMRSVMDTHRFEGVTIHFYHGSEVIPYLAPHELRRLFGGVSEDSCSKDSCSKDSCKKDSCSKESCKKEDSCGCEDEDCDCDSEACDCGKENCDCPPKSSPKKTCDCPPGKCTCGCDSEACDCGKEETPPLKKEAEKPVQCLCKVYEFKGFYTEYE